jgi:hypothetical protein
LTQRNISPRELAPEQGHPSGSGKMTSATGEIIALAVDNVLASIDIQFA